MAGVLFVMAACTRLETDEDTVFTEMPISFSTAADTRAGRTYVQGITFAASSRIGVFCYYTGQTAFGDGTACQPNFMYHQLLTKQSSGAWVYEPVKYWPNGQGDKLTFCAYYPYRGTGITLATDNATAGLPQFTFTVQEHSVDEVDFMLSDVVADEMHVTAERTTTVGYRVLLRFHHALSRIVLRVVDDDDNPLDFEGTVSGWYDSGTCQPSTSEPVSWSSCVKGGTVFTTRGATTDNERLLLLIPGNLQAAGMDALLHFSYVYRGIPLESEDFHLNATGASTPEDTTDDLTQWEPGKTYIYTYTVSHSGNHLSVTVNPWYQAGMVFANY